MSDEYSSSSYRIEPLNGENYHTWRIQMQDILAELELWEYVSGDNTLPTDTAQQSAWRKKDAKALRAIRLRIAKDVLVYAQDAKTSKEAWDTLAETFQESGPIGIIEARRKLFRAQCPEGGDIEEHLRKLRSYRSELHALGQTLSDADFSMIILTSLPDSWNPFIRAIDPTDLAPPSAGQPAKLTSAKLIARIHQEDRRSKREDEPETALKAVDKSNTTCHKCGRRGHWARECRSGRPRSNQRSGADHRQRQDSSRTGGRPQDSRPRTRDNNSRAYIADDRDSESDGDTPAREVLGTIWIAEDATNTPESALAAADPDVYYLDSGATTHVARDRIQFRDYSETPGKIIKGVGGHDIPQLGEGTVPILARLDRGPPVPLTLTHVAHVPSATHNLVSVARLTESGHNIAFRGQSVEVRSARGELLMTGTKAGRLYRLAVATSYDTALSARDVRTWDEWHKIFAHLNYDYLRDMVRKGLVTGMDVDESIPASEQCRACIEAKHRRKPYPQRSFTRVG